MALGSVVSMAMKVVEYLVAPVGRQFGYLICYERNIKNLKKQVQKLEDTTVGIQLLVDGAKRNMEIIGPDVERWLITVDELRESATKFLEDEVKAHKGCLNGWCPNLNACYSLSRKAKKKTQAVVEVCEEGKFSRVSYFATPGGIIPTSTKGFKGFESRRSIMYEVMEALASDSIHMIGICGMGGVGKTTMVKEVAKKAKENKLFDEVVFVVVSQNPDWIKIQGAIAEQLAFKSFEGNDLVSRARYLRQRILSSKRVLVILDDVWDRLELDDIGIPFGDDHKGCKIVLTSRSEDVCNQMGTQKKITIQVLLEEEAWNFFKEMAGISSDINPITPDLHFTQKAVAKECGGLPIAIVIVGRALNGKDKPSWDDALKQLEKSTGKNIRGVEAKVFQSLELSYNYLESEEAKKCFLLCSLFLKDSKILIEDLVRHGIGLELFEGIDTVGEARNRVHSLVDGLMKCYLLMDDITGFTVRMHDVIRDVAISIASREEHSFVVRCDEALVDWIEKDRYKNCAVISLKCNGMQVLPDNLEFPKLHLLRLEGDYELPSNFYQGMKNLKVLALSDMSIQSMPTSLRCLTNLRTLSLRSCELSGDISVIGALKNLEILSFYRSNLYVEELPKEIAHLTGLKLLDLMYCDVERISPGVLSSLSRLEELYVWHSVKRWSVPSLSRLEEGGEKEELETISDAASITELASLSNLVALGIQIQFWPRDFVLVKVKKFRISVGEPFDPYGKYEEDFVYCMLENSLKLSRIEVRDVIMESGIQMLLKSTAILKISGIAGLKNILCDLYKDSCEYLKKLKVAGCQDLEYLINTTNDGVPQRAFPVLESLCLWGLPNFKGIICHGRQLLKTTALESNYDTINIQPPLHNK